MRKQSILYKWLYEFSVKAVEIRKREMSITSQSLYGLGKKKKGNDL